MSNFLAIATVTATLQRFLHGVVCAAINEAKATATRPDGVAGGTPQVGVNIFLYHVKPNGALRNADLPSRSEDGALTQRPRAALDLHYLLTFYGDEKQLEPQRLLGGVARALHARPILTRKMVSDTLKDDMFKFLIGSDLDKESEMVRLTPLPLSLEDLSKLWSVFFQTPYALSVAYEASVVLIEGTETPRPALPVQERTLTVLPFRFLEIESIASALGPDLPVLAGGTLILRGRQLRGDVTCVVVSGNELTPLTQNVSDEEIRVVLPLNLPAGINSVQVSHKLMLGKPATEHRGFESNVAAFVLTPKIKKITNGAGSFTIDVDPRVRLGQRVALLLNNVTPTGEAHTFFLDPLVEERDSVTFSVSGLKKGEYFVRLQVDGAESSLLDLNPTSPTFKQLISPQVTIP